MLRRRAPQRVPGSSGRDSDPGRATDPAAARANAVALLARRDLPSGELRERLAARGFDAAATAEALAALASEGALDDARFARNYVASHAGRGHGPVRIRAELRARGLAPELIETALTAGLDWQALAAAARVRRFGRPAPADSRDKARQARFLQYRGFSADHIRAATGADSDMD